jgi:hypothetical protein
MSEDGLSQLSLGEAHCYVAIAKADGRVTRQERARAPYHARESQKRFGLFRRDTDLAQKVGGDVTLLLNAPEYRDWTADQHLDEGVALLRRAAALGSRGVDISADKLESGLFELAYLDGYDIRESAFVKKAVERLRELEDL